MSQGRVLIVEDDPMIRMLVRTILEGRGLTVSEAADGPSAHPQALEGRPDLVLLDIGLPGLDGFGVLNLLKSDPETEKIPVIMVTAWAEPELVAKALDRGAFDFVRKPFQIEELSERVDAALRSWVDKTPAPEAARTPAADPLGADSITALPNRKHVETVLERQIEAFRRTGRSFSVIVANIDRFHAINDDFGPAVGDDALRAVAKRLRQRARVSDVIGRWASEAFMIVVPGAELGGAGVLAEDLRTSLAERPLDTPVAALHVTASFGVAAFDPVEVHNVDLLVARADAALRRAKADGRNSVRLAEPALQYVAPVPAPR